MFSCITKKGETHESEEVVFQPRRARSDFQSNQMRLRELQLHGGPGQGIAERQRALLQPGVFDRMHVRGLRLRSRLLQAVRCSE
jgi:hypothetical protein